MKTRRSLGRKISLKRLGQPEDIAKVAVFLASDNSAFINRTVIRVDGGESINPWAPWTMANILFRWSNHSYSRAVSKV